MSIANTEERFSFDKLEKDHRRKGSERTIQHVKNETVILMSDEEEENELEIPS